MTGDRVNVQETLSQLGWFQGRSDDHVEDWGRRLSENGGFAMHSAARSFLQEFGGLSLGEHTSRTGVKSLVFNIDPTVAIWETDRFEEASREVGDKLYPVGEAVNGQEFIAIGERGDVYLVMDMVHHIATTAWGAFERLISHG